jgi:hypothetical protein
MLEPSPAEIRAFIQKLRTQASFLGDPALIDAADFIQRMYDYAQMRAAGAKPANFSMDVKEKVA